MVGKRTALRCSFAGEAGKGGGGYAESPGVARVERTQNRSFGSLLALRGIFLDHPCPGLRQQQLSGGQVILVESRCRLEGIAVLVGPLQVGNMKGGLLVTNGGVIAEDADGKPAV